MSKKLNEINKDKSKNKKDNDNNNSANNSNIFNPARNSFSDQLIFFKEDILKEVKQLESQIVLKYKTEIHKNDTKIVKMEETIETMRKNLEKISSSINTDNTLLTRTDKLSELFSKLEQKVIVHDLKIQNTTTKFTEDIDKLDTKITDNIYYPLVIGPNGKYKTFHEFIDFVLYNLNNLIMFKEKINSLLKELKSKTETNFENLKIKLDYQTKSCNEFTLSSIKESEQKMNNALEENLNLELEKFNKNFENYKENLEEKFLNINEKLQKIEILEENFEKIKLEKKEKEKEQDIEKYHHEKIGKYYLGPRNTSSIIKQYIEGNIKNEQFLYKRRRSFEKSLSRYKDSNGKINIKLDNKSLKNNKNKRKANSILKISKNKTSTKSENNSEKLDNEASSISDNSEIGNNIELRKNKIKDEINNILFKNVKTFKELKNIKEGKDKYISSFLQLLYPEKEKKLNAPNKEPNNINNKIKLIQDNENIPINKDLYITNNLENNIKNENIKFNDSKVENAKSLQLSKINSQPILNNNNSKIKINKEVGDLKDIINSLKKQSKESLLPAKFLNKNQKGQNKNNRNRALMSLTFKQNSTDRIFLNMNNNENQNRRNINDFLKKQKQNDKINKSQYNKITMNFSDFQENNKEKDEQKMKKIFNDLNGVIQEDEKFLIKKRFVNYGYNKDIIFVEDKKNIINRNDENKNNIFKINNNGLKLRPNSKYLKK